MKPDDAPNSDDALPPDLAARLRASQRQPVVPASVDRAVRAEAVTYFQRQRRVRRWVRFAGSLAAGVAVAIGVRLALPPRDSSPLASSSSQRQALAPPSNLADATGRSPSGFDIDRNGAVDILDAFTVARGIRADKTEPTWDVTGDGKIDQADVDAIANQAVRVEGRRQ